MKPRNFVGLVAAGGVNQSFVARAPELLALLGPVMGSSLRVARRITNGLRAGSAVADYAALRECDVLWVCVPEKSLDHWSGELVKAVELRGKTVVLFDMLQDSRRNRSMRNAGAHLVTLNCVPESGERVFVAEGHAPAISELRKQLTLAGRKLIELKPGTKTLYLSGTHLGAHLLMPWIAGSVESFRAAGFSRAEAMGALDGLASKALRSYAKAGTRAWDQRDAERVRHVIESDFDSLRRADHRLAAIYSEAAERLLRMFSQPFSKASAGKRLAKVATQRAS